MGVVKPPFSFGTRASPCTNVLHCDGPQPVANAQAVSRSPTARSVRGANPHSSRPLTLRDRQVLVRFSCTQIKQLRLLTNLGDMQVVPRLLISSRPQVPRGWRHSCSMSGSTSIVVHVTHAATAITASDRTHSVAMACTATSVCLSVLGPIRAKGCHVLEKLQSSESSEIPTSTRSPSARCPHDVFTKHRPQRVFIVSFHIALVNRSTFDENIQPTPLAVQSYVGFRPPRSRLQTALTPRGAW